jgi:hypothetical protein
METKVTQRENIQKALYIENVTESSSLTLRLEALLCLLSTKKRKPENYYD